MANITINKPLAAIYGRALYEAARDAGVQSQVTAELVALQSMRGKDPRVAKFFETPTIPFDQKREVINTTFKNCSQITRNFLIVIAERGRAWMLGQIIDA